ncbi:P-loop containing nucleoside triphosphate hydrolase protein [Pyronema domesticum]|nr:P-loop containing nucleoside triphosphate hydrolase protein [Pyronema domesticum]
MGRNDYDDDDYYDEDEEEQREMTAEERAQMKSGLKATRDVLGTVPGLTDAEIEESLYYYYFDVEKTINYLLNKYAKSMPKKPKPAAAPAPKAKAAEKTKGFKGPSPDDTVQQAQSGSKGLNKGAPAAAKSPDADVKKIEKDVDTMRIDTAPAKDQKDKIDVLKAWKESTEKQVVNFVVVGHVDAGKSTLMGRLLYDTGAVAERTLQKFRKESEQIGKGSFALAWVMDSTDEERERGVTIDIATSHFSTPKTHFTILDAPGHADFIPNMIAGASQADFAVLVIDSSPNAFEAGFHRQGQTKEHTLLLRSLGVKKLVVAVNKLDVTNWSQDRYLEILQQVEQFTLNAGYRRENITFVPLAGLSGINVIHPLGPDAAALTAWYSGPTLLEALETATSTGEADRAVDKPLRLILTDVFRGSIQNPVSVSGRIDSGHLQAGDEILCIPSKQLATIKSLSINETPAQWAVAGHNVVLNLANIDPIHLRVGDVVCDKNWPLEPKERLTMKLLAFETLLPMSVDVHKGRLHAPGEVKVLLETVEKGTGVVSKIRPRVVKAGELARVGVMVQVEHGVPIETGDKVVLRSRGVTVAAGVVE